MQSVGGPGGANKRGQAGLIQILGPAVRDLSGSSRGLGLALSLALPGALCLGIRRELVHRCQNSATAPAGGRGLARRSRAWAYGVSQGGASTKFLVVGLANVRSGQTSRPLLPSNFCNTALVRA